MADKAYPDLQEEARKRLALNGYLAQLDHSQVAFGVKQKNPESLDAAVTATLEMEAYATTRSSVHPVSSVADETGSEEGYCGSGRYNQQARCSGGNARGACGEAGETKPTTHGPEHSSHER